MRRARRRRSSAPARAIDALAERGVPEVWRASIAEAVAVLDLLDGRLAPIEADLGRHARADDRAALLRTIWHRLHVDVRGRQGHGNAAKSAVARKVLIAVWHLWSRQDPSSLPQRARHRLSGQAPPSPWPPDGPLAN